MNGDYTKVPLRRDERWTGARMLQGRVLLDHDWNLNLDAAATATQRLAADAIGAAGVVVGSDAFKVGVTSSGTLDLTVQPGRIWVDGLAAFAPAPFDYLDQDQIEPLPVDGTALVYLDVFEEHVQPAEDPLDLVDPALAPIDSTARTRVGYRVRVEPTTATTCAAAWAALVTSPESTGRIDITRTGVVAPTDPCDPPGDPLAEVPDGLFRVEVLDPGPAGKARFAWSFEDGGTAITVVSIAGDTVTLAPATVSLATGDLVEVSWLARRADRAPHGDLYTIAAVAPAPGGDVLTLDRAVDAPAAATGLVVRRWDGSVLGATTARAAAFRGADLGVRFSASAGTYQAGDWWGARLRAESGDGIEHRVAAVPDGTRHAFAPLALVDLATRAVLSDCRPKFTSLVDLDFDRGCCTVSVKPGDDLQAAVDSLPAGGGELCFAAGTYLLAQPLSIVKRSRVVLNGAGPATILRAAKREAAVVFDTCSEVEVRHLRADGGAVESPPGDAHLEGALTFVACRDVVVADCVLTCPDSSGKAQTCVTVRSGEGGDPDRIRIERNRLQTGAAQTGVLVVDAAQVTIDANHLVLGPAPPGRVVFEPNDLLARDLSQRLRAALVDPKTPGVVTVDVPGATDALHLLPNDSSLGLVKDFVAATSAAAVRKAGGARKALLAYGRALGSGKQLDTLSAPTRSMLAAAATTLRCAGQGIVVAGARVGDVRVRDNVVEGTVQGIHVGVSETAAEGREAAASVLVSRNVVHALVPSNHDRDRHGIFVGNARSVHVTDTVATLARLGKAIGRAPTPVEGIRIHGTLGPFMTVRQSSLQGFAVGVRVVPVGGVPNLRMWLVAETFADGASTALDAPLSVDRQRNVP